VTWGGGGIVQVVKNKGICLDKLNCLARCNGATTRLKFGDSVTLEEFRQVSLWPRH
jgi:hypothetical protein